MRLLVIIFFLFWVADGRAGEEGTHFSDDEQMAIVLFVQKMQQQIGTLIKEREEAIQERNKFYERLMKQGQCV